jgi:phosphohistidine phosphatase
MGLSAGDVHEDLRLYPGNLEALLSVLAECPARSRRIMLVGHNPSLEHLLSHLSDGPMPVSEDSKLLPTATLGILLVPGTWKSLSQGCARLETLVRPATLPKKFPFPAPDGEELRDRPAYYYSQSSVIPFRDSEGAIEILVIASSQNKHCVVPKGIHDPGSTARDSAAKEAWEEAGVEGEVLDEPLGTYVYDKWGATCTVTVYPMRVDRMLPEAEWEERHRGREWLPPGEAKSRLKQQALAPMVRALVKKYG